MRFMQMLYLNRRKTTFNATNLNEFESNLDQVRSICWLKEFPRGAKLLSYLF